MEYDYTTEGQVRKAFWIGLEQFKRRGWRQNDYSATIRAEIDYFLAEVQS